MEMCPSNQLDLSAEALQIAALSQTLTSIKKSKYKEASQGERIPCRQPLKGVGKWMS